VDAGARVALARNDAAGTERHFRAALATIADARKDLGKDDELKLPFANLSASLQHDYVDCWSGLKKNFNPGKREP